MTEFLLNCYKAITAQARAIPQTLIQATRKDEEPLRNKSIILTGCGDSYAVAHYGEWIFHRFGMNAIALSPTEIPRVHIDDNTVIIGITASGRSRTTIAGLQHAKSKQASIIVLTDNRNGRANAFADEIWLTHALVDTYNISPSSPTTCAMAYLLKIGTIEYGNPDSKEAHDVKQLQGIGTEVINWAENIGHAISEMVVPKNPLYLIADGPNYVAAELGQMKFNEYSLLYGLPALREEFCHHWNLNLNEGDRAILITDGPRTNEDEEYERILTETIGMVVFRLFAPTEFGLQSDLGTAIVNTIAMQMAAYHTVKKHEPKKSGWRLPHANAFKIY